MRRCLIVIAVLLSDPVPSKIMAQKFVQNIQQQNSNTSSELYREALFLYAPELLPEEPMTEDFQPVKCGFGLNYRIRHYWDSFSMDQKTILKSILVRPSMPFSHVSSSGLFKIHYDTTGFHGVNSQDTDNSGVPDYVEKVAVVMDSVYALEVLTLSYLPPPSDQGQHGTEWDVYIRNISYYGSTEIDEKLPGSLVTYSSYLILDNDYTHTFTKGLDGLRVTAAHEFFHMIQLGYNARDDDNNGWFDDQFFMEASSTWIEDVAYDDINDYYQYLDTFFNRNNLPIKWMDGWREYGLCIWLHFLEKQTGIRDIVRLIWDEIIQSQALIAVSHVLEANETSLGEALSQFYMWNYFTGDRADIHRFYPEGDMYPEIRLDGAFPITEDTSIVTNVVPTGARYYQIKLEDETKFTFVISNNEVFMEDTTTECSLSLKVGGDFPLYIDLGKDIKAQHFSEDDENWSTQVIVEDPIHGVMIIPLNPDSTELKDIQKIASFPNPFVIRQHERTILPFQLSHSGDVTIWISNASGHRIYEKRINGYRGLNQFQWHGEDSEGRIVPSGIYLYVIRMNNKIIKRNKIAVVR